MNSENLKNGITAGIAGGIVFGIMMGAMGMLPMIGMMVGMPNAFAGFIVHMGISAMIGASFAVLLDRWVDRAGNGLKAGMLYGFMLWILGPLTLMPLFMGMGLGVNWNSAAATAMLPSLFGHLLFGLVLGASYARLKAGGALPEVPDSPELTIHEGRS